MARMTTREAADYGRRFALRLLATDAMPSNALEPTDEPDGDPVDMICDWAHANLDPNAIRDLIGHLKDYALLDGNVAPTNPMVAVMRGPNAPPRLGSTPEPSEHLIGDPTEKRK